MRFLAISIFFICLVGCKPYAVKQGGQGKTSAEYSIVNPYFSNPKLDYVYKANIDVYNNSFGGIFIVKKIDDNQHRIVFTTEMGNKIFDFSFYKNDFKVNFILDELNKKILINILKKDFAILIKDYVTANEKSIKDQKELFKTEIKNKQYFYAYTNNVLQSINRVRNGKEKVQFLFSNITNATAKNIQILHNNIKLTINLKSIN